MFVVTRNQNKGRRKLLGKVGAHPVSSLIWQMYTKLMRTFTRSIQPTGLKKFRVQFWETEQRWSGRCCLWLLKEFCGVSSTSPQAGAVLPPPWDTWRCLWTFLDVTLGEGGAPGTWWVETRDAGPHPTVPGTPHPSVIGPQMLSLLRLRNPALARETLLLSVYLSICLWWWFTAQGQIFLPGDIWQHLGTV